MYAQRQFKNNLENHANNLVLTQPSFLPTGSMSTITSSSTSMTTVMATSTEARKARRASRLGMRLTKRTSHMPVSPMMRSVLRRDGHHGRCFILCDSSVRGYLVSWNGLERVPGWLGVLLEPFMLEGLAGCEPVVWVVCE